MQAPFEILEHTADIGVLARGCGPARLFENAAAGMIEIAFNPATVEERQRKTAVARAPDREALLVSFLDEIVWLIDGEGWLPRRVAVVEISDVAVEAELFGEPRDPSRHEMRTIVKAVTFHQLALREPGPGRGEWQAEIYFDI